MTLKPNSNVLVTVRFFDDEAVARLQDRGYKVLRADIPYDGLDSTLTPAVEAALDEADAWIIGAAPVTSELLERFPRLRIVARRGVGFDSVDVDAILAKGRVLTNTPGGNEPAVADHTVALMLAVGKRVVEANQRILSGDWRAIVGTELYQKTVGLIGVGRIGRHVARRLSGFDCRVLAYDPHLSTEDASAAGVKLCSLEVLLAQSHYVSLHLPLTPQTRNILDSAAIKSMRHGAILVNTSRGGLVDEVALLDALMCGNLAGAGLDVFECEHDASMTDVARRLLDMSTVVGTPHTAASTHESLRRSNATAADCVSAVLSGLPAPEQCVVADGRMKNFLQRRN